MQHHSHAAGQPPHHMRGTHHMLAGHPPPPPTAHLAAMSMGGHTPLRPPPHQPQPNPMKVQGQQQQPHINNNGPPVPPATSATSSSQQLRQRPPQQQYSQQHMQATASMQMHNIRQQQHQQSQPYMNGNFNNNSTNNDNKNNNKSVNTNSNYHQQKYNVNPVQRVQQQLPQQHHIVSVDQQQPQHRQHPRNVMPCNQNQQQQQQQQQQVPPQQSYMPHINSHQQSQQTQQQQQQKHAQTNNSRYQQQIHHHQQQVLPTNNGQPKPLQQKQQQKQQNQHSAASAASTSASGNITTKNNNNILKTKNFSPKSILQNPHRLIKSNSPGALSVPATAAQIVDTYTVDASNVDNNIALHSDRNVVAATENVANIENASKLRNFDVGGVEDASASKYEMVTKKDELKESNKENILVVTAAATCNEREQLPSSKIHEILTNIDTKKKGLKDKTAMCLVNELARFNQIPHQYSLVKEEGPPHSKHFSLILKLGDEEFPASANRIKTAQHNAAEQAIKYTKYKHPIPKPIRRCDENKPSRPVITPTVELNALAMKLGQPTFYIYDQPPPPQSPRTPPPIDGRIPYGVVPSHLGSVAGMLPRHLPPLAGNHPYMQRRYGRNGSGGYIRPPLPPPPPPPLVHMPPQPGVSYRGGGGGYHHPASRYHLSARYQTEDYHHPHYQHQHYASLNTECKVTLVVGKDKFEGIGRTMQQAKHNVAAQALKKLKEQVTERLNDDENHSVTESDSKSPISMVHEIGIKRSLNVDFKVAFEDGPAHMRHFVTECQVGHLKTQGEGNGKKISKKRAAEKMLEQLKKLPPIETPPKTPMKRSFNKGPRTPVNGAEGGRDRDGDGGGGGRGERRKRSVVRERNTNDFDTSMDTDTDNPITKLTKIQQMLKDKEPIFTPISSGADSGNNGRPPKRVPFIMEVSAQGKAARGTGHSKKSAKRNAAQNLLSIIESEEQGAANVSANILVSANSQPIDKTTTSTMDNDTFASKAVNTESVATKISAKELLDLPVVETSAGLVPGILILRQSKKNLMKKKEISTTNATTENITDVVDMPATAVGAYTAKTEGRGTAIAVVVETNSTVPTAVVTTNDDSTTDNVASTLNDRTATTIASTKTSDNSKREAVVTSTTATVASSSSAAATSSNTVLMKDQLMYLAKLLRFDVNFSDYPKGNHNEFLTIVTLSTNPPQICHGVGTSSEESQNDAAKNALKILSELGLNNAK